MTTAHLDDGALIRWLDDACEADERPVLAEHLERCIECHERLRTWRRRSERARGVLRKTDPVPRARRPVWTIRVAAAVLVLLSVGVTVAPVRAWIVDRVVKVWTAVAGTATEPRTAGGAAPQAPPVEEGASVTFAPGGEVFVLEIASRQAAGRLIIEAVDGTAASATARGGDGTADFLVLPSGLRIENAADSRADYVVRLPVTLRALILVIAGETARRYEPATVGERWTVPLGVTGGRDRKTAPGALQG